MAECHFDYHVKSNIKTRIDYQHAKIQLIAVQTLVYSYNELTLEPTVS